MNNKINITKDNIINYRFSIFGNFDCLLSNINQVAESFKTYKKNISSEVSINGVISSNYQLLGPKDILIFRRNRIDFVFLEKTKGEDCKNFLNLFNKIKGFLKNGVNRIAINLSYIYEDKDKKVLNSISSKIPVFCKYDNNSELNIRQNNLIQINNKQFNDIISVQNQMIQKSNSFESFNAIIFSLDINSVQLKELDGDEFILSFEVFCEGMVKKMNSQILDLDKLVGYEE